MTHDRWTSGDAELTNALRALYAAPADESYWDALVFVSTCLSVGYSNAFACTAAGKALATALMSFGPALAARALDPPRGEASPDAALAVQTAIADKLDAILVELRRTPPAPAAD